MSKSCLGKTADGNPCGARATASGYCFRHDPARFSRETKKTPQERFLEVVESVKKTAKAKGWRPEVTNEDRTGWKYASVSVSRSPGYETVTGNIDITIEDGVNVNIQKTSFHGYGLSDLHAAIISDLGKLSWLVAQQRRKSESSPRPIALVETVLRRFHVVARQLQHRHSDRPTLIVSDEYDVQDLLQALLRINFEDIRPEEAAPSYAGGGARIDFLLKAEKIVVESKFASAKLRDKQIGEQLLIDIQRYQSHPDCRTLVCFVYDPGGFLKNPAGLANDLSRPHGDLIVRVIVTP